MLGVWDRWLEGTTLDDPILFGDATTYERGARWLMDCDVVEDWGCGKGGLRRFVPAERYRGVDGSTTPFADVTADLTNYRSSACGVFIRHVLEHNFDWALILENAAASAQHRLFIALFTPISGRTHQWEWNTELGVPDISFAISDIIYPLRQAGFSVEVEWIKTRTQYDEETIIEAERL